MFKKILYPTKFEEFALPILKNLGCLKAGGLEEVIIVNVIETESLLIIRDSGLPLDFDRIRDSAQRKMVTYAEYLKAEGITVKTKIVEGSLVPEILKAADEEDVSLIVAGRQAEKGYSWRTFCRFDNRPHYKKISGSGSGGKIPCSKRDSR
jgi:nucleotide-binding universal stress UspA family protein